MATLNTIQQLTLIEQAKRIDPSGNLHTIAEILAEENEILYDAPWMEGNQTWSNETVRRGSLPSGSWRKLNAGVDPEASQTDTITDVIGMLESYSEPDKAIIDSMPKPKQARQDEASSFIEGMGQTLAATLFYGNNSLDPDQLTGLAPRMASANKFVIDQGGSGADCTSIYIVAWGPNRVFLTHPRNMPNIGANAGILHEDLGQRTKVDSNGKMWEVYRDHFVVRCGLVVKDSRCIARLGSIETTGASNIFDEDELIRLITRMPKGPKMIYVNDTVAAQMQIRLKDKSNVHFTPGGGEGLAGEIVARFMTNPIRNCDAILDTETAI